MLQCFRSILPLRFPQLTGKARTSSIRSRSLTSLIRRYYRGVWQTFRQTTHQTTFDTLKQCEQEENSKRINVNMCNRRFIQAASTWHTSPHIHSRMSAHTYGPANFCWWRQSPRIYHKTSSKGSSRRSHPVVGWGSYIKLKHISNLYVYYIYVARVQKTKVITRLIQRKHRK